jgi:hypothetical protein
MKKNFTTLDFLGESSAIGVSSYFFGDSSTIGEDSCFAGESGTTNY